MGEDGKTAGETSLRAHERKHMFIIAQLSSASMTTNVRVRNMSNSGALIEADRLPPLGEQVKLRRGELTAAGKIVRTSEKQAGIRFDRPILAIDWLPRKAQSQSMVDMAFETIKPSFEGGPPVARATSSSRSDAIA